MCLELILFFRVVTRRDMKSITNMKGATKVTFDHCNRQFFQKVYMQLQSLHDMLFLIKQKIELTNIHFTNENLFKIILSIDLYTV